MENLTLLTYKKQALKTRASARAAAKELTPIITARVIDLKDSYPLQRWALSVSTNHKSTLGLKTQRKVTPAPLLLGKAVVYVAHSAPKNCIKYYDHKPKSVPVLAPKKRLLGLGV